MTNQIAECYGVPYIPEGQWLCRKCFASPMDPVTCLFCPSTQGAFKQTSDLHWAHLLCTNWIPEVTVGNPVFMEPIEGVNNIPASRWKLTCYICKLKVGACIQCSNKSCYTSFHVSCARRAKLFLQQSPGYPVSIGKSFCDRHLPDWYRADHDIEAAFVKAQNYFFPLTDANKQNGGNNGVRGKFVVSLKRTKQSAVIPAVVYSEILFYMRKFKVRNKAEFIAEMCKYWSLKRRSRRGLSLLKRLQLQIEDNAVQSMDEVQKELRISFGKQLLNELDNFQRPLFEDVLEREILKHEKCEMRDLLIDQLIVPLQPILKEALLTIEDADNSHILPTILPNDEFTSSVPRITWPVLVQRVEAAHYLNIDMFANDFDTFLSGILEAYTDIGSRENKLARRLRDRQESILQDCRIGERILAINPTSMMATCFDSEYDLQGLSLLEEKPYNWANRDASPLSDLDDDLVEELGREVITSETGRRHPAKVKHSAHPENAALGVRLRSRTNDLVPDGSTMPCRACTKTKVVCNGQDPACEQQPYSASQNTSSLTKDGKSNEERSQKSSAQSTTYSRRSRSMTIGASQKDPGNPVSAVRPATREMKRKTGLEPAKHEQENEDARTFKSPERPRKRGKVR